MGWTGGGREGQERCGTYSNCSSMNACVPCTLDVDADVGDFWEAWSERRKMIPTSLVLPVRDERRSMRASVVGRLISCREVGERRRKWM